MIDVDKSQNLAQWSALLRSRFVIEAPELLTLFDTYAEEAHFGRSFIAQDLADLPEGTEVLEVGAGAMILSCQLVREGLRVCALEPTGSGFSHFDRMRNLILQTASEVGCLPEVITLPAELLDIHDRFDYAFSVNVMEHVDDVAATLKKVAISLRRGGEYHFVCPNYLFPYEPHFNIPTLFSKKLTERLLKQRIFKCAKIPDPVGTWSSLNWINLIQVRRLVSHMHNVKLTVDRGITKKMFDRILTDRQFSSRRSVMFTNLISILVFTRMHKLLRFLPACTQPMMDCRLQRTTG